MTRCTSTDIVTCPSEHFSLWEAFNFLKSLTEYPSCEDWRKKSKQPQVNETYGVQILNFGFQRQNNEHADLLTVMDITEAKVVLMPFS